MGKDFVVLEFSFVQDIYITNTHKLVELSEKQIVEVAAVKICECGILNHFHSFVAIDGYDSDGIEFPEYDLDTQGVRAEHIIGAPSFECVAKQVKEYVGDSTILLKSAWAETDKSSGFNVFIKRAKDFGFNFDNPVLSIMDIVSASIFMRKVLNNKQVQIDSVSILDIAKLIKRDWCNWVDLFADYNICFDVDCASGNDRNDILTWALMFANLFVAIYEDGDCCINRLCS